MSDVETKPTTIPEPAPAVAEPVPAPVDTETAPAEVAPVTAEEPAKAEEVKEVEPIYSGALKYVTGPSLK